MPEPKQALLHLLRHLLDPGPAGSPSSHSAGRDERAMAELRRRLEALSAEARASLLRRVAAVAGGGAGTPDPAAAAAALQMRCYPGDGPPDALLLYLLLWLVDISLVEAYEAKTEPFDLENPPADFWYQRVDTEGSHSFFDDGNYLVSTIPATGLSDVAGRKYYNSEIYNSTQTAIEPSNVIFNLFPVDDPRDPANFLYDLFLNVPFVPRHGLEFSARVRVQNLEGGSRGWGFWNTSVLPPFMQVAWFIQFDGKPVGGVEPFYPSGFYAQTQNGLSLSTVRLTDLDEEWHDYRITITKDAISYYVDEVCVEQTIGAGAVPAAPMAFHDWVDNAIFGASRGAISHILQETTAPRSNIVEKMRIRSLPDQAGAPPPAAAAYRRL